MAVPSEAWDETTPNNDTKINKGDDAQRTTKTSIREIISVDHEMAASGQTATTGQHKQVTCQEQADLGTGAVGATILGSQTVSGKGELVYTDEDDTDVQITASGYVNTSGLNAGSLPSGVKTNTANYTALSVDNAAVKSGIDAVKLADGTVTNTEFQYINTLASNAQTQIDSKVSSAWDYDSDWFATLDGALYTKAHGISMTFPGDVLDVSIHWRESSSGSYQLPVGLTSQNTQNPIMSYDGTNIYLKNSGSWGFYVTSGGSNQSADNGELKVLARKVV